MNRFKTRRLKPAELAEGRAQTLIFWYIYMLSALTIRQVADPSWQFTVLLSIICYIIAIRCAKVYRRYYMSWASQQERSIRGSS